MRHDKLLPRKGGLSWNRRALLERLRAQRETLVGEISEATRILADTETEISELERYKISRQRQ